MVSTVVPILVGLLLIVLGIVNMTGNVSTLHSYHRQRVTEENRKPFGKMVGLGTLIAGLGIVAVGVTIFLAEKLQNEVFVTLGIVLLPTFLIPGIVLMVIAMKKYNGGIF